MMKRQFWWIYKYILVLGVVIALSIVWLMNTSMMNTSEYSSTKLVKKAIHVRKILERFFATGDFLTSEASIPDIQRICQKLSHETGSRASIVKPNGWVIVDANYGAYQLRPEDFTEELRRAFDGELSTLQRYDSILNEPIQAIAIPIRGHMGKVQAALHILKPIPSGLQWWRHLFKSFLIIFLIVALFSFAVTLLMTRKFNSYLTHIASRAQVWRKGDLHSQIHLRYPQEWQELGAQLNSTIQFLDNHIQSIEHVQKQWHALFTHMKEGIIALNYAWKILTLNQVAAQIVKLDPKDESSDFRTVLYKLRNVDLQRFVQKLFDSQTAVNNEFEVELTFPNQLVQKSYRISGVKFSYMDDNPPGILLVFHDITQLRHLEAVRQDFISNVSHELKTPVTAIKGAVETLKDCIQKDPEAILPFLDMIGRQSERMGAIIHDLLVLSQLDRGTPSLTDDFQEIDIYPLCQQAVQLYKKRMEEQKIILKMELRSTILTINAHLVEQAIHNLLENAIKYSKREGEIHIYGKDNPSTFHLSIADKGIGITPEHQKRIFERFYRVDPSRSRETGGTGLGLAIVKHIMTLHAGYVSLKSELGKGACFTLVFPKEEKIST